MLGRWNGLARREQKPEGPEPASQEGPCCGGRCAEGAAASDVLTQKTSLLRKVAETLPDVVFLYDLPEDGCVYVNRHVAAVLGFSPEEIEKMGTTLLQRLLSPEDLPLFATHMRKCVTMADGDVFETEYRFRHANGAWRWFHYRDTIFARDSAGMPQQVLCMARDITERKEQEQALRDQEVQAALKRMASLVAYEINNSLANLKNLLFLMKNALILDHPDAKYFQWTEEEIDRVAQTVRRIATFSHADS
ncbi:MAG TPA: PAS domain-containing protein [Methylomirabilota bacterium]|nr:PAS domain-containing protein [Methylomirabilota bacterium]